MKNSYRLYRRKNLRYYTQNNATGEQCSLGTTNTAEAKRLLDAKNQSRQSPALNLQLGKAFITHADPSLASRVWQEAMNELCQRGGDSSRKRYERGLKAKEFDLIRHKPIIETTSEDLKLVLRRGGAATNNFLRRLHNLALDNGWIQWQIISPKQWEKRIKKQRRAITLEEHIQILASEKNTERRSYYDMLWKIGAAQTDCSLLQAGNIDWEKQVFSYTRKKTGETCWLKIGPTLATLLKQLPAQGFLFPYMAKLQDKDRSAEFGRRCRVCKIKGISLHSYRYAWAERAYKSGYAERYAQAALGHKTRAVHHYYAKNAQVVCPPLEDGACKIIPINSTGNNPESANTSLAV